MEKLEEVGGGKIRGFLKSELVSRGWLFWVHYHRNAGGTTAKSRVIRNNAQKKQTSKKKFLTGP